MIGHVVAKSVLLELGLASVVVEQVLAGEEPCLLVRVVRSGDVGVVIAVGVDTRETGSVHTVAIRVVD